MAGLREVVRFALRWVAAEPATPRRAGVLLGFFVVYPLLEAVVWAGLWADEFVFRAYRKRAVSGPVFIVGNFRSGTTFLHRLLARDEERFATMRLWEILFAPSVCARVVARWLTWLWRGEARDEAGGRDGIHPVTLGDPEEDDYLFLHIFQALTVGLASGLPDLARPYAAFDDEIPAVRRKRLMRFYAAMIRRHLHFAGGNRVYLSKNPAATPKIRSILEEFPDARLIVLVRDPADVLPSISSMMRVTWRAVGANERDPDLRGFLLETARDWYRRPREVAERTRNVCFLRYGDLVGDPGGAVNAIYRHFGIQPGPAFAEILARECAAARAYTSRHEYSAESEGFSRAELAALADDAEGFPWLETGAGVSGRAEE